MNTCGNCKYFGEEIKRSDYEDGFTETGTGFHPCERIKHYRDSLDYSYSDLPNDPAIVQDGSGYFAALRVKEDFGCVMFEEGIKV